MSEEETTMTSLEADEYPAVKALAQALQPLPISNERLWAIIHEHQTLEARVYAREAVYWRGVADAALDALQAAVNLVPQEIFDNDEATSMKIDYAFKKREEFKLCGSESPQEPPPSSE